MQDCGVLFDARRRRVEKRIMIVDDDLFLRKIVVRAFLDRAAVLAVDDNDDVVAAYREYLPDIVFMDIHLTSMSGMELMEQILSCDGSAHVVIMSSDTENADAAVAAGAKGFLAKPFTRDALDACFRKCETVAS